MDPRDTFTQNARRKVLNCAVAAIMYEAGFSHSEKGVLETLVEILTATLNEIGRSSRAAAELAGRTEVMVPDVVLALVEMGLNVDSIPTYAKQVQKTQKLIIPAPSQAPRSAAPKILQAGEKKPHLPFIPSYLPPFPDPHSYIRTQTHKQPVTEYEAIREKSASQKRDVERALTRFMAKTSDQSVSHSLFPDDHMNTMFPLIALKTTVNPYLQALLPKDQIFDDDEEEEESSQNHEASKDDAKQQPSDENAGTSANEDTPMADNSNINANDKSMTQSEAETPDNPYLRPPKISKKKIR